MRDLLAEKVNNVLNYSFKDIKVKEFLDIIGYSSTVSLLGLLAEDVFYNYFTYKEAVVYASMSMHNEHYIEMPLLVYTLLWNTKNLIDYIRRGGKK